MDCANDPPRAPPQRHDDMGDMVDNRPPDATGVAQDLDGDAEMNLMRIKHATAEIDRLTLALEWLTEHGVKISHETDEKVSFRPNFAGSCNGSKEAAEVLNAMMTNDLPRLIPMAIENVENTFRIHYDTIRNEAKS